MKVGIFIIILLLYEGYRLFALRDFYYQMRHRNNDGIILLKENIPTSVGQHEIVAANIYDNGTTIVFLKIDGKESALWNDSNRFKKNQPLYLGNDVYILKDIYFTGVTEGRVVLEKTQP